MRTFFTDKERTIRMKQIECVIITSLVLFLTSNPIALYAQTPTAVPGTENTAPSPVQHEITQMSGTVVSISKEKIVFKDNVEYLIDKNTKFFDENGKQISIDNFGQPEQASVMYEDSSNVASEIHRGLTPWKL